LSPELTYSPPIFELYIVAKCIYKTRYKHPEKSQEYLNRRIDGITAHRIWVSKELSFPDDALDCYKHGNRCEDVEQAKKKDSVEIGREIWDIHDCENNELDKPGDICNNNEDLDGRGAGGVINFIREVIVDQVSAEENEKNSFYFCVIEHFLFGFLI